MANSSNENDLHVCLLSMPNHDLLESNQEQSGVQL
jgi:hypothetical protein